MKKALLIMSFLMAILVVNAQSTRTSVMVADLHKAIKDNIAKDYVGFTIKEATKVTVNNVVTYDVVVTKGTTIENLVYDKDGKFISKKAPAVTQPVKSVEKPATTPAPIKK